MRKSFVYKKLIAFVVVLTLLFADCATMVSTQSAPNWWGGGNNRGNESYSDTDTVNIGFFWGYDTDGTLLTSSSDTTIDEAQLAAGTSVYLGTSATGTAISSTTIGGLKNNGVTIVPPAGWYVSAVIITCNDGSGYDCQTAAASNIVSFGSVSVASAAYTITGSEFSAANSDSSKTVFHGGRGSPYYLMIKLERSPDPVTVKYVAGDIDYSGKVNNGASDIESYTNNPVVTDYVIKGANAAMLEAAEQQKRTFIGWEVEYYNDNTFSNTDASVSASGVRQPGSTIALHRHVLLTAKWVVGYEYTVAYHLETSQDGVYEIDYSVEHVGVDGATIYSKDHLGHYTVPEGYVLNETKTEVSDVVTTDNNMVLDIYYDRAEYTVTYYVTEPGATAPTKLSEKTYSYGDILPTVVPTAIDGYTSYYWYETNTTNTAATKASVPETMPAKNLVYYGFYDINSYKVTYYFNNVEIGEETYDYGTEVTVRDFPTPPAGKYIEDTAWLCENPKAVDSNGSKLVFTPASTFKMPATNLQLHVRSDGTILYTVKWVLVDGSKEIVLHSDSTHTYGSTLTAYDLPTHEKHSEVPVGYSAHGWYEDASLTTDADIPATVTEDLTFYAGLNKNSYTVHYYFDGVAYDTETYEYGANVTVIAAPVLTGHSVYAWYTDNDDPGVGNYGTADKAPGASFTMPANNVYLYAWSDIQLYNIEYYLDGVRLTPDQINGVQDTYAYGAAITPAALPEKIGYTVSGWYDANRNFVTVAKTMPAHDLKYYAYSAKNSYTVQYFIDGTAVSSPITVEYGATVTAHDFDKYKIADGKELVGDSWTFNLDGDDPTYVIPHTVTEGTGTFTMPASNVKLSAVTKTSQFELSYWIVSEDGKTVTQYGVSAYPEYNQAIDLVDVPLTTDQYTYSGWYTTEACTTLHADEFNMPAMDVKVYAKPTTNKYTVEYHIDGVYYEAYGVTSVPYGTEYTAKAFPEITGKEITNDSWTVLVQLRTSDIPTSVAPNGKFTMPAANLILEATTKHKEYKINYYVVKDNNIEHYEGPITAAYEATVDVAYVPVDPAGLYEYSAWQPDYKELVIYDTDVRSGKAFTMPAKDIDFYSYATQENSTYEVRYVDIDTKEEIKARDNGIAKIGDTVTKEQPSIHDYVFADDQQTKSVVIDKDADKNVITFYYKEQEFTVTYYFNGDQVGNTESYKKGEEVLVRAFPEAPVGKYIESSVWNYNNYSAVDSNGNALVFAPGSKFYMPETNLQLYVASNGEIEYTVTWILVDGEKQTVLHTDKYVYNQPITERHLPTSTHHEEVPEGYSTHGWYTNAGLTDIASIPHHVTENLTFYAGLDENDYNVYYHLDGKLIYTKTYEYGSTVTVADKPVWDSHQIEGWYTSSDDPGVGNFGKADYEAGSQFTMPAKDIYLYAWSDIKLYNVRYYLDGVRLTPAEINDVRDSYEHGESVIAAELPVKTGHTVSGWFDKNGNAAVFPTAIDSDLDYYAVSDKAEYTVQYFINDTAVSEKFTYKYCDTVTADAFAKYEIPEGSEFVGDSWTFNLLDADAESVPTSSVKEGTGTFTMPASDIKLCAVTKTSKFELNYWIVSEDGTVTQYGRPVYYDYGHEVTLLPTPKADHSTYSGWYTTESCSELHANVFNMPAKTVNVYAKADKNDYVVHYYIVTDGEAKLYKGPFTHSVDDVVDLENVPVDKAGIYEYSAWVSDVENLVYQNSGEEFVMPNGNVNFYSEATKVKTTYTIIYVDAETNEEIDEEVKDGDIGETVTEEQPNIPGYEPSGDKETVTIVLVEDDDENIIIFYYDPIDTETTYRVDYKIYDPRYDTSDPDTDHLRYRTLDYYEGVAEIGDVVTARNRVFAGYTEIPGQKKTIVISEYSNRIIVLYTDDSYDGTPDYYIQYFFNGVLDDSMTVSGEGNVGDVIRAEDYYLDDPTYTLVDVKPADEITLEIGVIGIINIYYEYEVEEPDVPAGPVIPVDPTTPEDAETPDEPIVDDPDNKDDKDDENKDDEEEPFVPQQPGNPVPPNTSDVSYVYGILAVMAALAAAGVLASKKLLR